MFKTNAFSGFRSWQLLVLFTLFLSCKKDIKNDVVVPPNETVDLSTKINSSVSGFVTNENNEAVAGAEVKVGTVTVMTDRFGYFNVKDVQVVKQAATVTVSYAGYFRLVKTYFATEGKAAFFRIKLLQKAIAGTIDAADGGMINIPGGATVQFPANAIKTAAGSVYNGQVNVAAQYLDPTSPELSRIMPGDLRGVSTENRMRLLTTYGMVAVELTGAAGEELQIADGKKATITMPIPASYSADAPLDMPLWYFDENTGLWKEEGKARRNGNQYIGEVSHFSFWNCDIPGNYVYFDCTIVTDNTSSRTPVPSCRVKLTEMGNSANSRNGITNVVGYVGGMIPSNTTIMLEVFFDHLTCSTPLYSETFLVGSSSLSRGDIVVTLPIISTGRISGVLSGCNGSVVSAGSVMIQNGYDNYHVLSDSLGNYEFNNIFCSVDPMTITLTGQDFGNNLEGNDTSISLFPNTSRVVPLSVCGGGVLFNIGSNGYMYHPSAPRPIIDLVKVLTPINATTVECPLGDLGPQNYRAYFETDPITNLVTVTAAPGAAGGVYYQWNSGLPTDPPGPAYTPQWAGSALCNNTYDPVTRQYRMRYGYIGGTGYRVAEEIIQLP